MDVGVPLEAVLARRAVATPDQAAVLQDDERCNYGELDRRASEVAAGLVGRGVRPGDRVAVLLGSTLDHVVAVFGLWRAGAVWVPSTRRCSTPTSSTASVSPARRS